MTLGSTSDAVVQTESLTKRYGSVSALTACSLSVQRGEVFGLLGPNGSGKTTLLRMLLGFLRPTEGRATIDNLDCWRQSVQVHERVSYLPGDARLFRQMKGRDVLQFFSRLRGATDVSTALAMADRLRLDLSRAVATYSTGMRQKLALAITLSAPVPLVILDEPTANLDPTVRGDVVALVRQARAEGRTVLFSSHVLEEVEEACDRVCILRGGQLVHIQVMSQLRRQHRIHAQLTGPLHAPRDGLAEGLTIQTNNGHVTMETPGELSGLLGWLATLPLAEVRIEPVGLRAVYDRYHGTEAS